MIRNKVQEQGLVVLDPTEWLWPEGEVKGLDLALLLDEGGILREQNFRERVKALDTEAFRAKAIALYCSAEAIWPPWAVMLLTARLMEAGELPRILYGSPDEVLLRLSLERIAEMPLEPYRDARVMVKACSRADWAPAVYQALSARLLPVVQSLFYGEPCSAVPVYKRSTKAWVAGAVLLGVLLGGLGLGSLFSAFRSEEEKQYRQRFWSDYKVYSVPVPEEMHFAGEKVPLWDFEFRERVERELLQNAYGQATMLLYMKRAARWFPMIEPVLKKHHIPDDFKYLAVAESGLANAVSSAEAVGFWQFLAATARQHGLVVEEEVDQRYDPWLSTEAACKYLRRSYSQFGDWTMVAASYNMGTAGLQQAARYQGKDCYPELHLNMETSRYLPRILAIKTIMQHPERYGFHLNPSQTYLPFETRAWTLDEPVVNWALYAKEQGMDFRQLKIFNPWIRKPYLRNRERRTYTLRRPTEAFRNKASRWALVPVSEWGAGLTIPSKADR